MLIYTQIIFEIHSNSLDPKAQNIWKSFLIFIQHSKPGNFYIFVISSQVHSLNSGKVSIETQLKALPELSEWTLTKVSYLRLRVTRPMAMGEKFNFFSPFRFDIQIDFDHETSKIKFHLLRLETMAEQ